MKHYIPESARKKHIAILGMNGSGKTSVAKAELIEPALLAGERVCNIDPTGVGWGLRLARDGKKTGFKIYIVGGERADFPLERRDGETWGDIVGTSADSFVFDTSLMTVQRRSEWFTDFAETLIRKNKGPLNFILDEAHLFAPQAGARAGGIAPAMLHATNNLLALGRSKGLRIAMISQRPAKLHKDSLTQAHTLIAMMMTAPQDRHAVEDWIADQADEAKGREIISSLATLAPGEGWLWAPREGVLERIKFSRPTTFDSSSAPDTAEGSTVVLPSIDPEAIKGKLANVAKEKTANDPVLLRAEIARLQKELKNIPQNIPGADPKAIEDARFEGYQEGATSVIGRVAALALDLQDTWVGFREMMSRFGDQLEILQRDFKKSGPSTRVHPPRVTPPERTTASVRKPLPVTGSNGTLPPGERAILIAAVQYQGVDRDQLSVLTGYKRSSRDAYIQRLREKGYVEANGQTILPTDTGSNAFATAGYELLPTGVDLQRYWQERLPEGERKIIEVLIEAFPASVDRNSLDDFTGYKRSSRDAYIQRLRARRLVTTGGSTVRAHEMLF